MPTIRQRASVPIASLVLGLHALLILSACDPTSRSAPFPNNEGHQETTSVFPTDTWERVVDHAAVGYSAEQLGDTTRYAKTLNTTAAIAILGGRVLWEYGDLETVSYLASVRKSLLSMLYGNYVADGTIDLDATLDEMGMDDIGGLLEIEKQATIRHLITARSGVYHPASNSGDNLADAPSRGSQEPGTYILYSNWDFNAAGGAFELATGRNIFDALESDLAIPLGMREFDRSQHQKGGDLSRSRYPSYHMHLSTRDMARIGYLMLREGNWSGAQLVPADWTRLISSAVTPTGQMNPESRRNGRFGYGYMWWVFDGEAATNGFEGGYTASGAWGQFITVLPTVDMVVAHKTVPDRSSDGTRRTSREQYLGIVQRLLDARLCAPDCG